MHQKWNATTERKLPNGSNFFSGHINGMSPNLLGEISGKKNKALSRSLIIITWFVEENLSAIRDVCHFFTCDSFVIFAAVYVRPTAGFWIGTTTHVVNSCLLAYVLFWRLLFLLTFGLVCIHRILPGPQSNCLWKFCKVPTFPCWFCVLLLS